MASGLRASWFFCLMGKKFHEANPQELLEKRAGENAYITDVILKYVDPVLNSDTNIHIYIQNLIN